MLEKRRHQLILDILDERQFARVVELTEILHSSQATIRRDLLKLANEGKVERIRGGAQALAAPGRVSKRQHLAGSAFLAEREHQAAVKRRIAQRAVELCEDGEFIIINGGSSTFMMGEFLMGRDVSILTNSFVLAQDLAEKCDNRITLTGGEFYRKQGIVLSAYDHDLVQYYHAGKMFMGTPGICDAGVTESDPQLIRSEQHLLKQSEKLIVLADSSKLGKRSSFICCPLERVNILITDSNADEKQLDIFRQHGVETLIVDAAPGRARTDASTSAR